MSVALLDGNVLVALAVQDHMHHQHARDWLSGHDGNLATCPITQGTLLRFLVREGLRHLRERQHPQRWQPGVRESFDKVS